MVQATRRSRIIRDKGRVLAVTGRRPGPRARRPETSTFSRDIAAPVSIGRRSTAPWEPGSTSHRLLAPGGCARVLPETPMLRPMDAERSVRPGACPRTDSELPKTNSRRPSPRCERRSCGRSCARSLAWASRLSGISSRSEEAHSRPGAENHGICIVPRECKGEDRYVVFAIEAFGARVARIALGEDAPALCWRTIWRGRRQCWSIASPTSTPRSLSWGGVGRSWSRASASARSVRGAAHLWTLRDRRVTRCEVFLDRSEALEAMAPWQQTPGGSAR
jgi:hypothetical protein